MKKSRTFIKPLFIWAMVLLIMFIQCKKDSKNEPISPSSPTPKSKIDSLSAIDSVQKEKISFTPLIFPKKGRDSVMAKFLEDYSEDERYVILALNRLDDKNKWRADTLVIPNKIDSTLLDYSPFPARVNLLKNIKKMVFFYYPIQGYAVYSDGVLQKWGPTSMGKESSQTPRGLHFTNWKSKLAYSTVNSEWKLPYNFNIENKDGVGWRQYDLPGFPASHSCLRLLMNDAIWLYSYADQWILNGNGTVILANGTPVIVYGDYDWKGREPWKSLLENPDANSVSESKMEEIIQPFLEKIVHEQTKREQYLQSQLNPSGQ